MKILGALAFGAALLVATPALADTADGDSLIGRPWEKIVETARGGTVNFFLWGGADTINRYVSEHIGGILREQYRITLNRVGIGDTVEAVNLVLGEREAGVDEDGAVDLIWINGENFRTLRQADLVFCGYVETLPNNVYVDWDDPAVAYDFGLAVEGCEVPWSRAQFAFAHDSARIETPPADMGELLDWIEDNPGQFTYPAPPDFNGSAFVRHVFYHAAGDIAPLLGDFDQALYDEIAPRAWEILNGIAPHLWRGGETYPVDIGALNRLYANREVAFTFDYDPSIFGVNVDAGIFPETTRAFGLADGTIANTSYIAIPYNSPNKAAAMVLANLLLSPEAQLEKARPDVWGAAPGIDVTLLRDDLRAAFEALPTHPSSALPEAATALPELQADWLEAIEAGWREHVGQR